MVRVEEAAVVAVLTLDMVGASGGPGGGPLTAMTRGLNSSFTGWSPTLLLAALMVDMLPATDPDMEDERLRRPPAGASPAGSLAAISVDSLLMSWMML